MCLALRLSSLLLLLLLFPKGFSLLFPPSSFKLYNRNEALPDADIAPAASVSPPLVLSPRFSRLCNPFLSRNCYV